ncbi:hypothetical protein TELCIR_04024 [Teladorsagia circumcincta]|uniref:Uncharacterized protein n=1 Tax=Teladorsagia circumcincta TaxID=45464 RepID=A0A2G9UUR7_TELCI|nr:hypothetical protein TELCIR_04024 [Teladorsagia circumcincta]
MSWASGLSEEEQNEALAVHDSFNARGEGNLDWGFSLIEQARAQRPADLLQRNLKYMKYTDKKRKLDKNKAKKIVLEHMRKKTSKELIRKERSKITGLREPKNEKKKDKSVFTDADFAVVGKKKKKFEKIPVEYL